MKVSRLKQVSSIILIICVILATLFWCVENIYTAFILHLILSLILFKTIIIRPWSNYYGQ